MCVQGYIKLSVYIEAYGGKFLKISLDILLCVKFNKIYVCYSKLSIIVYLENGVCITKIAHIGEHTTQQ